MARRKKRPEGRMRIKGKDLTTDNLNVQRRRQGQTKLEKTKDIQTMQIIKQSSMVNVHVK